MGIQSQGVLLAIPFISDGISVVSFVLQITRRPTSLCKAFANDVLDTVNGKDVNYPKQKRMLEDWAERIRLDRLLRAARTSSLASLAGIFSLAARPNYLIDGFGLIAVWIVLFMLTGDEISWTQLSSDDVKKRKLRASIGFVTFVSISVAVKLFQL